MVRHARLGGPSIGGLAGVRKEDKLKSDTVDLSALTKPTIVEVWSPSCAACRAMEPDLNTAAGTFASQVDLLRVNASDRPESARALRVLGTPTLIGVSGGTEVFRVTGRRSPTELRGLFAAAAGGGRPPRTANPDVILRLAAGFVLLGLGLLSGPVWPLLAIGTGVVGLGLHPLLRSRV
jgi:thiol-disulfide isomerase/thioredoxin